MKQSFKYLAVICALFVAFFSGRATKITPSTTAPISASGNLSAETSIFYSLDKKENDQELISVIENAHQYLYFAIYTFTKQNIADAIIAAKERGVDVRGIMDRDQSQIKSQAMIMRQLTAAGIPMEVQQHSQGIMHIKALVTEHEYALGSYNWTNAATYNNDEVLEIGTDENLRRQYLAIIKEVLMANQ